MNNQKIMKIDAKALFKYFPKKKDAEDKPFVFDTRKKSLFSLVVNEVNEMEECPLFYQFSKVLEQDDDFQSFSEDERYMLYDQLIIMDFDDIFMHLSEKASDAAEDTKNKQKENVKELVEQGLDILFPAGRIVHMIPFDKSGNMSRNSRISFVNDKYADDLNKRLNLGINFSENDGIKVELSKYYAYRGLYLSTSTRVKHSKFKLTPETIVIVKDYREESGPSNDTDVTVVSAIQDEKSPEDWQFTDPITYEYKRIEKPFDGEGLITETYANYINESLNIKGANSFQIRLPFVKGMIHKVNVLGFIDEFTKTAKEDEKYLYFDAFGIERDLKKAHIFLTESMLKCKEWLVEYCKKNKKEDPMAYYCEMLNRYEHSLYISGTNLPYGHSKCTQLSYQTINTLAFTEKQFVSVMEGHGAYIKNPIEYIRMMDESEADTVAVDDKETRYYLPNWKKAVQLNPALAGDTYIKTQLNNIQKNLVSKIAMGKIVVEGQTRYLCRDLLPLISSLLREKRDVNRTYLKKLYSRFYLPQGGQEYLKLNFTDYYAFFRNPHLSRNEQFIMRAFVLPKAGEKYAKDGRKNEKKYRKYVAMYDKYFGHLTGIVMIPSVSSMPLCLGGADFDGDLVSVIVNRDVVAAVQGSVYKEEESPSLYWYSRALPTIEIPTTKAEEEFVPKSVAYTHINNTFANHIGRISNAAIAIGQEEYNREKTEDKSKTREEITYDTKTATCDKCTLLTGLEIDAAKHGMHPNLDIIFNSEIKKSVYLNFLKEYKDLKSEEKFKFENLEVKEETETVDGVEKAIKILTAKDCITEVKWYPEEDEKGTYINCLPKYFFLYLDDYKKQKESVKKYKLEKTALNKEAKSMMNEFQLRSETVFSIYNFYNNKLLKELKKEKKRGYYAIENTQMLIMRMYDEQNVDEVLFRLLPGIKEKIENAINTDTDISIIRQRINDMQWQFQPRGKRGEVLERIIGGDFKESCLTEQERNVLYHFNQQGYKLLWRILDLIEGPSIAAFDDLYEKAIAGMKSDWSGGYEDLDIILKEEVKQYYEYNSSNIEQAIYNHCLKKIKDLISDYSKMFNKSNPLVESLYQKTKSTVYKAKFFWNAFSWDDMRPVFDEKGE